MNKQMFLDVADAIEAEAEAFDMTYFVKTPNQRFGTDNLNLCGSTACVCGWVNFLTTEEDDLVYLDYGNEERACELLGITKSQGTSLFFPNAGSVWVSVAEEFGWQIYGNGGVDNWSEITGQQAAEVLRRIANGELNL